MCQFEYFQYQKCGHKAIEISEYCNIVFWRAGMTSHLTPCPEQNFRAFFVRIGTLDGLDFGTCKWIGLSGYCKICEKESHMPKAIPYRTYEDYEFLEGIGDLTGAIFAVKLAEPITYPPPSQSIQYSSTPNEFVTKEFLEKEIAKPPSPPPLISVEDQDISTLLSIQDKDIPEGAQEKGTIKELRELYFPAKLQMYELNQGVDGVTDQWRNQGYYGGRMLEGVPPSQYFWDHVGMTPGDEQYLVDRLKDGIPLLIVWREKFKERGMDLPMFYQYGRKLEEHFQCRVVRANSRMGKIEKELSERSQAADGIQPFGTYQQNSSSGLQSSQELSQRQISPFGYNLDYLHQQRLQQQMQQIQQQRMKQMVEQQMVRRRMIQQQQAQQQSMWQHQMQQRLQDQQQQFFSKEKGQIAVVEEVEIVET
ncbi:predicted protein [Sclerotinia sclerotiorum 1980 UF-70]|uniref:Uncharacterized protein n=1 Tax=Sclerotinia sclerotiorum (strain ATCC 18683 / 1980 / Ss-1) TaxID=665079 RepID=A7ET51_SCLS1|nr:predicted protein [Sclerotinia sclerotiorum 1980 UF-70]EDN92643.1 predicted protein [Sclerotinia sclerotiorum 1980 UF-70]